MIRPLIATAVLATASALCTLFASSAIASDAPPATSAKAKPKAAKKPSRKAAAAAAQTISATNDNLNAAQLSMADRVLTGVADCEFKQKVDISKIEGHSGNFRLVYDHKTYTMVPEETTTGAIRLVDTDGAVVWVQIPMKSMLMNQREHHRLVDDCQEDEQRIATRAAAQAGANAPFLAPSAATPASAAVAAAIIAASPSTTTTTTTVTSVTTVVVPAAAASAVMQSMGK